MPADGVRSLGEGSSPAIRSASIRKGPKRVAAETDGEAAKWFDAAVGCWGKGVAYAAELGVVESFLSEMRAGKRGIALRHLLPLLGHPESVLAFVAPLLESVGYVARPTRGITPAEVNAIAARLLCETRASKEMLVRECERVHGATPEQVALALRGDVQEEP